VQDIALAPTSEAWSSLFEKEKQMWREDYTARKDELDAKWRAEQDAINAEAAATGSAEWKRLNRTDKERFLDDFHYEIDQKRITINQGIANAKETVGFTLWDASIVLSYFLEHMQSTRGIFTPDGDKRKRVAELGAGCGMVSISAGVLGADVVCTDCKHVIPLAQINVDLNKGAISSGGGTVTCKELTWSAEGLEGWPKYDYILAADCIYVDTVVEIFLRTMHGLADDNTIIYFAQQCHNEEAMEVLWARIDHYFIVRKVPPSEQDARWSDKVIELMEMKRRVLT